MKRKLFFFLFIICFPFICLPQSVRKQLVHFGFNEYTLLPSENLLLDGLIKFSSDSNIKVSGVEITAHCDSIGGVEYNEILSEKRATSVKNYLLSKGISVSLIIKTEGKGKREPLNSNSDSTERYLNRRAEILLNYSEQPIVNQDKKSVEDKTDISELEVNSTMVLKNLNFYPGLHTVLPASYPVLEELLKTLKKLPSLKIEIQGHVCCIGKDKEDGFDQDTKTWDLSEHRAQEVYKYLVKHGIDSKRLSWKGFGGQHRLVEERTEEDRTKNRRVEIKIISK